MRPVFATFLVLAFAASAPAADNELTGGDGNDTMTGGVGNDTFFFRSGGGSDRIMDFVTGTDKINLAGMGLSINDIHALGTDSGGNFVIDFGSNDVLTLVGRTEGSLQDSDFIL